MSTTRSSSSRSTKPADQGPCNALTLNQAPMLLLITPPKHNAVLCFTTAHRAHMHYGMPYTPPHYRASALLYYGPPPALNRNCQLPRHTHYRKPICGTKLILTLNLCAQHDTSYLRYSRSLCIMRLSVFCPLSTADDRINGGQQMIGYMVAGACRLAPACLRPYSCR